jgi:hypothetical protein
MALTAHRASKPAQMELSRPLWATIDLRLRWALQGGGFPGLRICEYPMIKDLSWLKISDVFAPNIRQISENLLQNANILI